MQMEISIVRMANPYTTLGKNSIAVLHEVRGTRIMIGHINVGIGLNGTEYIGYSNYGKVCLGSYIEIRKEILADWKAVHQRMKQHYQEKTKNLPAYVGVTEERIAA